MKNLLSISFSFVLFFLSPFFLDAQNTPSNYSQIKRNGEVCDSTLINLYKERLSKNSKEKENIEEKSTEGVNFSLGGNSSLVVPPSPGSLHLIENVNTNVNLYNGTVNSSVNIHNFKSNDISFPVSLSHNGSGVRVDDYGTWVGQSWNLNAGGSITRVMKNLPDEFIGTVSSYNINTPALGYLNLETPPSGDNLPTDLFPIDFSNFENLSLIDKRRIIHYSDWSNSLPTCGQSDVDDNCPIALDSQPDEFYFNFGGYSGKFVFGQDAVIHQIPDQNLQISPTTSVIDGEVKITKFEVITPEGYTYTFGKENMEGVEQSELTTTTLNNKYVYKFMLSFQDALTGQLYNGFHPQPILDSWPVPGGDLEWDNYTKYGNSSVSTYFDFTSTWHLTHISSPKTDASVRFNYVSESDLHYTSGKSTSVEYPNFRRETITNDSGTLFAPDCSTPDPDDILTFSIGGGNGTIKILLAEFGNFLNPCEISPGGIEYMNGLAKSNFSYSVNEITLQGKRLQSIIGSDGEELLFTPGADRVDMPNSARLDLIKLKYDGNNIKSWKFDYKDFVNEPELIDIACACPYESDECGCERLLYETEDIYNLTADFFPNPPLFPSYSLLPSCEENYMSEFTSFYNMKRTGYITDEDYSETEFYARQINAFLAEHNRSFLTKVTEIGIEGGELDLATFDYNNPGSLPERFSYKQDDFGYNNNNNNTGTLLHNVDYINIDGEREYEYSNISSTIEHPISIGWNQFNASQPSWIGHWMWGTPTKAQIGALKGIYYRTGLSKTFDYDSHNYEVTINGNPIESNGAGLRIKNITTSGAGINTVQDYSYSAGQLLTENIRRHQSIIADGDGNIIPIDNFSLTTSKVRVSSHPLNPIINTHSGRVGYREVTVNTTDAGSTKYVFTTPNEYPNEIPAIFDIIRIGESIVEVTPLIPTYAQPFPMPTHFSWRHGLIERTESYDEGGALVSETDNVYNFDTSFGSNEVVGLSVMKISHLVTEDPEIIGAGLGHDRFFRRSLYNYISERYNLDRSETTVYQPDGTSTTTAKEYTYNDNNNLTQEITTHGNGQTQEVNIDYPEDFSGSVYTEMLDRRMLSMPIEERVSIDGTFTQGKKTDFTVNSNSHIVPEVFYNVKEGNFTVEGKAVSWDGNGNITRYYRAKANASASDSPSSDNFFPITRYEWFHNLLDRTEHQGFEVDYTYNGRRLLETINDENSIVSNYRYDEFGRLETSDEQNGRVLKDYTYTFQPLTVRTDISYSDDTPAQSSVSTMDAVGRPISSEMTGRVVNSVSYDGAGRKLTEYNLGSGTSSFTYIHSPIGQMLTSTDGAGNTILYDYTADAPIGENGYIKNIVTDANGSVTQTSSDAFGLVTGVKDAIQGETLRYYDPYNRLETVQPPLGGSYDFDYTNRGLLATKTIPLEGTSTYIYDTRDRLVGSIDASGNSIGILYDNLDRPTSTGLFSGTSTSVGDCDCVEENSITLSDVLTTTEYEEDRTWPETGSERIINSDNSLAGFLYYESDMDDIGRVISNKIDNLTGSNSVNTDYNDAGLVRETQFGHQGYEQIQMGYSYTYDNLLRPTDTKLHFDDGQNTLISRLAYNGQDQVTNKYLHSEDEGSSFLQNISYGYDGGGRLVRINDLDNLSGENCMEEDLCDYNIIIPFGSDNETLIQHIVGATGFVVSGYTINYYPETEELNAYVNGMNPLITAINEWLNLEGYLGQASFELIVEPWQPPHVILTINNSSLVFDEAWLLMDSNLTTPDFTSGSCCQVGGEDEGDGEGGEPESSSDLFTEFLTYEGHNIIKIGYQTTCQGGYNTYDFDYDPLHRLDEALHTVKFWNPEGFFETETGRYDVNPEYDAIGNITSLSRNGLIDVGSGGTLNFGEIDNLIYNYTNLELTSIDEDTDSNTKGYPQSGLINHDGSGRMILEGGKVIEVEYNLLNLPRTLTSPLGNVSNIYTAAGRKIKKTAPNAEGDMEEREYAGKIEYVDRRIESIFHPEGRIVKNEAGEWVYEYAIKDHLGSTRVVFADIDDDGEVTYEEVLHENHYYPFGMNMEGEWTQPDPDFEVNAPFAYQHTGKELNVGVEWTDFGARWYDAQIGRFTTVDPLAEKFAEWSVYSYTFDNPISFIDPDGRAPEQANCCGPDYGIGYAYMHGGKEGLDRQLKLNAIGGAGTVTGVLAWVGGTLAVLNPLTAATLGTQAVEFGWGLGTDENVPGFADDAGKLTRKGVEKLADWDTVTKEAGEAIVSFFHKGNLKNGKVAANKALSTGDNLETVIQLAREGKVHQFDIPKKQYQKWLDNDLIKKKTDLDWETGAVNSEFRFDASISSELNKYKK